MLVNETHPYTYVESEAAIMHLIPKTHILTYLRTMYEILRACSVSGHEELSGQ